VFVCVWQYAVLLNHKHLVTLITRWSIRVQVRYRTFSEGRFEALRLLCRILQLIYLHRSFHS